MSAPPPLGWIGIARFGLVQAALGAVVVLTTSTINRVMVIELALPAVVPGALVALHYAVQALRPRWGYGSDQGRRRTPWIVGGMALLCVGGAGAAAATALMASSFLLGIVLAVLAFVAIGIGVGASGTALLVLLSQRVAPERRAPAATIVWVMMIAGFVATTVIAGKLLDPFSSARMVEIACGVCAIAFVVSTLAVMGLEGPAPAASPSRATTPFRRALAEVWAEPKARRLTLFIFASMLAYSSEELVLDPFSGAAFGFSPGQSTQLSGALHGGVLAGMVLVALAGGVFARRVFGSLRVWMLAGCAASAAMLLVLAAAGLSGPPWPLRETAFALGVANGAFSIAAIGTMMALADGGQVGAGGTPGAAASGRAGVRMGLWGAAQGVAFGVGGLLGAIASDVARALLGAPGPAYACVFAGQAALFAVATALAARIDGVESASAPNFDANALALER